MDNQELDKVQEDINNKNAVEDRMRNLSKDKKEAEERATLAQKERQEAMDKLALMEKEASFLSSFSDINAKFSGANEFKDKIKEKFSNGYSIEDATVAVLVAEGKYTTPQAPRDNVAGGSASNQITNQVAKSPNDMKSDERWAALREAEKRGDLSMS